ncbi:Uncharacterized protein OBRU01_20154, partial [Operophtera brumata]
VVPAMSTISEEYISSIVRKIASNYNLKECQHSVSKFESIGQNYFGIIIPVTITGRSDKGSEVMRIVLKLAPTDERYRVSGAVTLLFLREIFVYTKLLEKYRELQQHLPPHLQLVIPRVYYTDNEHCGEVIAMEDMSSSGYRPFVNEMFLDLEHVTVALRSLARLHALSYILKEQDPELYDEITGICVPLSENTNKRYFEVLTDRLTKALSKFEKTPHVSLLEKLRKHCSKYYEKSIDLANGICISHGDVWKENILFQYKEDKPVSCCLIDYQTTRMSSPAFDTLYLIISSTHTNLRRKHYHQLLDIYYQTFHQTLKETGLNSQLLYSTQTFAKDLKIVAPACLITANTALWLSNGLQEEGHVRSKQVWLTAEDKEKAVDAYKAVVWSIIDDFYKYGYLPSEIV